MFCQIFRSNFFFLFLIIRKVFCCFFKGILIHLPLYSLPVAVNDQHYLVISNMCNDSIFAFLISCLLPARTHNVCVEPRPPATFCILFIYLLGRKWHYRDNQSYIMLLFTAIPNLRLSCKWLIVQGATLLYCCLCVVHGPGVIQGPIS